MLSVLGAVVKEETRWHTELVKQNENCLIIEVFF